MKIKTLFISYLTLVAGLYNLLTAQPVGWTNYTFVKTVWALAQDGEYLWIGTLEGLVKFNKNTEDKEFYDTTNSGLTSNKIRCLLKDRSGDICIGLWGLYDRYGGLIKYSGGNWIIVDTLKLAAPTCIMEDFAGNIWLGHTIGSGVPYIGNLYKYHGDSCTIFTPENSGLLNNSITALIEDSDKNIWIGNCGFTTNNGLLKYDGVNNWDTLDVPNRKNILYLLNDSKNNIWVGTSKGLAKYEGNEWDTIPINGASNPYPRISCLIEDKSGNIWAGTQKFLAKFNGADWTIYNSNNSSLSDTDVYCLSEDSEEKIWIGTAVGLTVYDKNAVSIQSLPKVNKTSSVKNIYFNRFHNSFSIHFSILQPGKVAISMRVYNAFGRLITTLINEKCDKGNFIAFWNGADSRGNTVSNGMYLFRMTIGQKVLQRKVLLLK